MEQDKVGHRRSRSFNRALKTRILRECAQPGASVSQVARVHDISTTNIYRWRQQLARGELRLVGGAEFIPVEVKPTAKGPQAAARPPAPSAQAGTIEVELHGACLRATVRWPVQAGRDCAAFLQELLR